MRPMCGGCERPRSVCLCAQLPAAPLPTATRVVILQHPHETRRRLATVPVLARCLARCAVLVGRRLAPGSSPLLDAVASQPSPLSGPQCRSCGRRTRVLLLFPTPSAAELGSWTRHREEDGKPATTTATTAATAATADCGGEEGRGHVVLVVVDGTWAHAREMVAASLPFLGAFAEQVCLPHDAARAGWARGDSDSALRKEPFAGCVSTLEAVARALRLLEPDGARVEAVLLSVLRQMVAFQQTPPPLKDA